MSHTITLRVPKALASWLQQKSAQTGIPQGQIVREQLESLRKVDSGTKKFLRLAGSVRGGPRDLSTRKGYSKG